MAALAIASGTLAATADAALGGGERVNQVNVELRIAGLGPRGGSVTIEPGSPSCRFKKTTKKIASEGSEVQRLNAIPIDAASTAADGQCLVKITVREPGQRPRVYRRMVLLHEPTPDDPQPLRTLRCYLSSPSLAAHGSRTTPR